jgi:hypothetical protein
LADLLFQEVLWGINIVSDSLIEPQQTVIEMKAKVLITTGAALLAIIFMSFVPQTRKDSIYSATHVNHYQNALEKNAVKASLKLTESMFLEEEWGIESWMTTQFAYEREVGMELWMTRPFMLEDEIGLESWMTEPFMPEEGIDLESWMTASWL